MASADVVVTQVLSGIIYMMIAAIVLLVVFLFFVIRKHNLRVNFKEVVKGNFVAHSLKAKFTKDKDGVEYWKTLKRINGKKYFPLPPSECIYVDKKGRKEVDAYISPQGEVIYIHDPNREIVWQDPDFLKKVQPVTTNQRQIWINQERKAMEDRGFSWKQHLMTIAGAVVLVIIVVLGIFGYQDVQDTSLEIAKVNKEITQNQLEIAQEYASIGNDVQYIKEEVTAALSGVEQPLG